MSRLSQYIVATFLLASLSLVSLASMDSAFAQVVASPLTLNVTQPASTSDTLTLAASLPSNTSLNSPIHFYVTTKLFGGKHLVPIGVSSLNDGTASITYKPTWDGTQSFTATVVDPKTGATQITANASYDVISSKPAVSFANANQKNPLSHFGKGFIVALLIIVAAVWVTLLTTLFRVVRGMSKLAP